MSYKVYIAGTLLSIGFILSNCGGPPTVNQYNKDSSEVVIATGDSSFALTVQPLYDLLSGTNQVPMGGRVPRAAVREYVDSLLLDTLTGLAANDVDIRDYYLDHWTYRLRYHDFLTKAFFDYMVLYQIDVDSADVLEFYETNKELFAYPEQVELYHIFIAKESLLEGDDSTFYKSLSPSALDSAAEAYAWSLYDSVQAGTDFGEIAFRYSHDELSNKKMGYVGWTRRNQYIPPFDSVAFSLPVPGVSEPYQDRDGWHILMIEDYIPEGPVSLERDGVWDGVKQSLVGYLADSTSAVLLDSLRRDEQYEYNEDLLDSATALVDDSVWAAVVNDLDTVDYRHLKQAEQAFSRRTGISSPTVEQKKQLLRTVGTRFLIARAAITLGVDTVAYIRRERERLTHLTAKSILESKRFDPAWRPEGSMIRDYYDSNLQQFQVASPFRISQIVVNDSVLAVYLRDLAESGYEFAGLVDQHIPDGEGFEGRYEEIGWIGPDSVTAPIYEAAQATAAGAVSRPVKTAEGWHLVKVLEAKRSRSFLEAKGSISSDMVRQYRRERIESTLQELRMRYQIAVSEALPDIFLPPRSERLP